MQFIHGVLATALIVSSGVALAAGDKDKAKASDKKADKPAAITAPEKGRDWTLIDTNKDGFISPEEMEVWLKANPGPAK